MSRRRKAVKRPIMPDPKFKDLIISKFTSCIMFDGKKSTAEKIVYGALDFIKEKTKSDPLALFHEALNNVKPQIEVRSRSEKSMIDRLGAELIDASSNKGNSVKKREDTHKMAESNKAFAHYRW